MGLAGLEGEVDACMSAGTAVEVEKCRDALCEAGCGFGLWVFQNLGQLIKFRMCILRKLSSCVAEISWQATANTSRIFCRI